MSLKTTEEAWDLSNLLETMFMKLLAQCLILNVSLASHHMVDYISFKIHYLEYNSWPHQHPFISAIHLWEIKPFTITPLPDVSSQPQISGGYLVFTKSAGSELASSGCNRVV
jgi:hypothetical protein